MTSGHEPIWVEVIFLAADRRRPSARWEKCCAGTAACQSSRIAGSGSDRLPRSWGGREQEVAKTTELTTEERRERRRNGEARRPGTATRTPAAAGVTPHPAESNRILFSVRPPLAPFLRCELRSLRPLRTGRAAKLTHYRIAP